MVDERLVATLAEEAGFKVWKDGRITAADGAVSGEASRSAARLVAIVLARAATLLPQFARKLSLAEAAKRFQWDDVLLAHARDSADCDYGDECVIQLANARELRCPPGDKACDYVRITEAGHELMYWSSDEWRAAPEEVMGAILGLARASHLDAG